MDDFEKMTKSTKLTEAQIADADEIQVSTCESRRMMSKAKKTMK